MQSSTHNPGTGTLVVSRYPALLELALNLGLAHPGTRYVDVDTCSQEDVRGYHVITDNLSLYFAAYAAAVTIIQLDIPPDLNSPHAPVELLAQFSKPPQTFFVSGSAPFVMESFNGGTTAAASLIANRVVELAGQGMPLDSDQIAQIVDANLLGEREAAKAESELLLNSLRAEAERRKHLHTGLTQVHPAFASNLARSMPANPPPRSVQPRQ